MSVHVLPQAHKGRRLESWIGGFMEYTKHMHSTPEFRRWAAIAAVAGSLTRKVWIRSQGQNIYPNLYIALVGPPASGKTRAVAACDSLWHGLKNDSGDAMVHVAPVSLTKASLMDVLGEAKIVEPRVDPLSPFNSLLIASKELGALIPTYDPDFLNALTYIYDGEKYDEKRRGIKDALIIERPQINMIGCTTPSFLLETMPSTAWDQGFLSRVIVVYKDISGERKLTLEEEPPDFAALEGALKHDLNIMARRCGKLVFSKEAGALLINWYGNKKLEPTHPRLQHYNTRRAVNMMKLSIIAAIDADHNMIEEEDVASAIGWLTEAEVNMPDLFMSFTSGGDANVILECLHFLQNIYVRQNMVPIPGTQVWSFLANRVPAYRIEAIVGIMVRAGSIVPKVENGINCFIPKPR